MMKLKFKIIKNTLSVSIVKNNNQNLNINNTNVIDTKEIVFSYNYINENIDLVSSFLNVIIIKRNVKKVEVRDFELIVTVLKIINHIPSIEKLILRPDKTINYKIFLLLLENHHLKELDLYEIPPYLLERLDINKNLLVKIRSEIFFISNFMTDNNLNTYSDLYYKKHIIINKVFGTEDYDDFETFININHHLKTIQLNALTTTDLSYIINLLVKNNKQDIKIIIDEKNNDLKLIYKAINKVKQEHDKFFKLHNITFKINYSLEFKRNNLFKQINLNFIKISLGAVILLILTLMGLNYYKNYVQQRDIEIIEQELRDIISQIDRDYNLDSQDPEFEYITPDENDEIEETTTAPKNNYVSSYYKNYDKVFETLLSINNDTKGWLTVNNTRIDYPVVQAPDNEYYLKRDFNKYRNSMGWVFMDFRNNIDLLNQNTVIYGHNINGGIMFGTLRYVLNNNWYTKAENQVITFNTLNESMKWQIFSIYKIPNTNDYIQTTFYHEDVYQEFLDLISGRSIYDFGLEITTKDKILTLSTCHNRSVERVVVHAKLISTEKNHP